MEVEHIQRNKSVRKEPMGHEVEVERQLSVSESESEAEGRGVGMSRVHFQ